MLWGRLYDLTVDHQVDDHRVVVDVDMGYFIFTDFIGYFVICEDFIAYFDLADRDVSVFGGDGGVRAKTVHTT
jgi:hypothetical protein